MSKRRLHMNFNKLDEFDPFVFRTTGFNSIRTLAARLNYYHAASGGLLSCLPLQLTLRGKSTTQSYRQPVYYVDLTLREGVDLQTAIQTANEIDQQGKQAGFDQAALDQIARQGFANAKFEVHAEEGMELLEEFYPNNDSAVDTEHSAQLGYVQEIQQGLQQSVRPVN